MTEKRLALGKGLSALIPDVSVARSSVTELDIDLLAPNRFQPRRRIDDERLSALAQSIRASGVIQPIVVRRLDGSYQIIAGERRWRAAQMAGLTRVPVVIREIAAHDDRQLLQMALIENVQREDLNPIEEANAYRRLIDEFRLTQEEVASAVGKDRASVANYVRLLKLPQEVRDELAAGSLSMGHARALLALVDLQAQRNLAREVIARGLSVRETEALVAKLSSGDKASPEGSTARTIDVHTRAAEERLRLTLGTRVRIVRRGTAGRIEIDFVSEDELQRIYEHLVG